LRFFRVPAVPAVKTFEKNQKNFHKILDNCKLLWYNGYNQRRWERPHGGHTMELCLAIYKRYCTADGEGIDLVKVTLDTKEADAYLENHSDCVVKAMQLKEIGEELRAPKLVPMPGTEGDWNGRVKGEKV
jgi:hypothetical protein